MAKLIFYDLVKKLLTEHENSRDDDVVLYGWVVKYYHTPNFKLDDITAGEMLRDMANNRIPSFISIWRMRQKVQQDCRQKGHPDPCLCGKNWKQRLKKQKTFRQEIVNA